MYHCFRHDCGAGRVALLARITMDSFCGRRSGHANARRRAAHVGMALLGVFVPNAQTIVFKDNGGSTVSAVRSLGRVHRGHLVRPVRRRCMAYYRMRGIVVARRLRSCPCLVLYRSHSIYFAVFIVLRVDIIQCKYTVGWLLFRWLFRW